jgi:uncharacterized protein (UPF0212 family)
MDKTVKSSTETLIKAMYMLVKDIQSEDGVANAAIFEAAQRLEELYYENIELKEYLDMNDPVDYTD